MFVYLLIVPNQRLGKHVPAATNAAKIEELLDASFSMQPVSYQRRICGSVCVFPIVARKRQRSSGNEKSLFSRQRERPPKDKTVAVRVTNIWS
jgi:hypothetical protein